MVLNIHLSSGSTLGIHRVALNSIAGNKYLLSHSSLIHPMAMDGFPWMNSPLPTVLISEDRHKFRYGKRFLKIIFGQQEETINNAPQRVEGSLSRAISWSRRLASRSSEGRKLIPNALLVITFMAYVIFVFVLCINLSEIE